MNLRNSGTYRRCKPCRTFRTLCEYLINVHNFPSVWNRTAIEPLVLPGNKHWDILEPPRPWKWFWYFLQTRFSLPRTFSKPSSSPSSLWWTSCWCMEGSFYCRQTVELLQMQQRSPVQFMVSVFALESRARPDTASRDVIVDVMSDS